MKRLPIWCIFTCSCIVAPYAAAQSPASDSDRLIAIAQANIAEIATAKIALEKSSTASVRNFAQAMLDDHGKGLEETRKIAAAKNISLPSEPDAEHRKIAGELQQLSGAEFDRQYVNKAGVADHAKVHTALKDDMAHSRDADIKALATRLEPVVAHHGEMARKLSASLK